MKTPALVRSVLLLSLLGACAPGQFENGVPIYLGDRQITALGGGAAAPAAANPATECQRLTARTADASLNDFQRQAAANYAASLGC